MMECIGIRCGPKALGPFLWFHDLSWIIIIIIKTMTATANNE